MTTPNVFRIVLCICILLNVFDIVLHIAVNQPEVLRIVGNALVIIGSSVALLRQRSNLVLVVGLVSYLSLNGIFIASNGIGGTGIVFISLTAVLLLLSLFLHKTK